MKHYTLLLLFLMLQACAEQKAEAAEAETTKEIEKTAKEIKAALTEKGFEVFDYVDETTKDTLLMQKYFIAFLKKGPNRTGTKEQIDSLQILHLEHLTRMYLEGYADISGPFGEDGEIRGITIYNTPTLQFADSLANMDPMVKSGRLVIEMHSWWAGKGFPLR
ncbi:YciI family protein [Spongiimicrobium sp. 3-5]|uniref:YciI family protein n=1 Tax=Spongiimicrobium sp. 3-5 TaxID=3332596 RepID=UPI0039815656